MKNQKFLSDSFNRMKVNTSWYYFNYADIYLKVNIKAAVGNSALNLRPIKVFLKKNRRKASENSHE